MRLTRLLLVLGFFVPRLLAAQSGPLKGLDHYVDAALKQWEVPGLALAVVQDDSVIYARGYGIRSVGSNETVDDSTIFAIASTSKAFTAALVGMLVDEKKLSWDDRVADVYPGFRLADPYVTNELRVRDILSHRSGLPRGDRLWYQSPFNRDEVIRRLRFLEPATSFRSAYGYQNIMFITAGEVFGKVSGESWDAGIRRRIFNPLGMTRSSTSTRDLRNITDVAAPHDRINGKVVRINWPSYDNLGGAGAVNSTVRDMAQWIRLQLNHGVFKGQRLISDSVIAEMHDAQTVIHIGKETHEMFPETHFMAYGLGWSLRDYGPYKLVGHGGVLDGMRTEVLMVPDQNIGVVVMANMDGTNLPNAIAYRVIDMLLNGKPGKDWSDIYLTAFKRTRAQSDSAEAKVAAGRIANTQPRLALRDYAGTYADSLYGKVDVREENNRLIFQMGPYYVGSAEHWHFDTFRVQWNDEELGRQFATFVFDTKGKPSELRLDGLGAFKK